MNNIHNMNIYDTFWIHNLQYEDKYLCNRKLDFNINMKIQAYLP